MAANEKVKEFCNDIYATKEDVERIMKTPLISGIWKQILDYRKGFEKQLNLRHTNREILHVCYTPKISERINNIERKLNSNSVNFMRLRNALSEDYFLREIYRQELSYVATINNMVVEENILDAVIDGRGEFLSEEHQVLVNYYNCLNYLFANPLEDIDDNTIGNMFSTLQGSEDLTEFYRQKDIRASLDDMAANRPFIGVPTRMIESLMDDLMNFITMEDAPLFVKAVAAFYYFYFIRPFEVHNEEIACLLFKKVLAYNDIEAYAACLPIEKIANKEIKLKQIINAVQKDYDLTYLIVYFLDLVEPLLLDGAQLMVKSQEIEVKKDLYQADEEVIEDKKIETPKEEVIEEFVAPVEPKVEEKPQEEAKFEEENPIFAPIEEEKPVEPAKKEEIKPQEPVFAREPVYAEAPKAQVQYGGSMSIGIPVTISDEEAQMLADRLSEMDPRLSRFQAKFLARHCTVGMSYTVDQFKKEFDCAYETARSGMNGLVEMGYYEKKPFRKKFVYTPIRRK